MGFSSFGLLGGSNSILKNGLSKGLSNGVELKNFALGASSSLQNLHSLIRYAEEIGTLDVIFSESNVNDFHSAWLAKISISVVLKNIDRYYQELNFVCQNVVVLVLPLVSGCDIAKAINKQHLENIHKYGFTYLDLDKVMRDSNSISFYVKDNGHPNIALMAFIGSALIKNINEIDFRKRRPSLISSFQRPKYKVLEASDLFGSDKIEFKRNSLFNECVGNKLDEIMFEREFIGYNLLGFLCWSDGFSKLEVTGSNRVYVKAFNHELQFHEVSFDLVLDTSTKLLSNYSQMLPSEFSLSAYLTDSENVLDIKPTNDVKSVKIASLLLVKDSVLTCDTATASSFSIHYLLPDLELIIEIAKSELNIYKSSMRKFKHSKKLLKRLLASFNLLIK
jgi:hypothetical protein